METQFKILQKTVFNIFDYVWKKMKVNKKDLKDFVKEAIAVHESETNEKNTLK